MHPEREQIHLAPSDRLRSEVEPLESLLDQMSETIQSYGATIRNTQRVYISQLKDERIEAVINEANQTSETANRTERRDKQPTTRRIKEGLKSVIVSARASAQGYIWSDELGVRDTIKKEYGDYRASAFSEDSKPEEKLVSETWIATFEACKDVNEVEKELLTNIRLFLSLAPNNILQLLDYLNSPELDTDEQLPLLKFLSKNINDKYALNIITRRLGALEANPDLYLDVFKTRIANSLSGDEETQKHAEAIVGSENVEWLRTLSDIGSLGSLLDLDYDLWPEPLRQALENDYSQYLQQILVGYHEVLDPYVDKTIFYTPLSDVVQVLSIQADLAGAAGTTPPTSRTSNKRRTPGDRRPRTSSRATPRIESKQRIPEVEEVYNFKHLERWARSSGSVYVAVDTQPLAEPEELDNMLLDIPEVKDYLSKHNNEQLNNELLAMLQSILKEPRGNGATMLTDAKISFNDGSGPNKRYAVWHLNPTQRSNLPVGDIAKQTRIYYTITKNSEGEPTITILRIGHKNDLEKLRGNFNKI